ncbi:unnamed protein product [Mytilus coruscus]|uniref:Chromo domain-containing protein n=1 Tax=Mytilus coruscus TaxID=42192 RepID=A0A6J8D311_MYTCO|nr:unnamed protein product [Mytilus coruscus]
MRLPFDVAIEPQKIICKKNAQEYINEVIENLRITREIAKENVKLRQEKSKEYYDRKTTEPEFRLHDKVLLRLHRTPVGKSPKLIDKYEGPFYITKIGPNYTFRLRKCSDHKELMSVLNASRLKHYSNPRNHRAEKPGEGLEKLNASDRKAENNAKVMILKLPKSRIYLQKRLTRDSGNDELIDTVDEDEIYFPVDKLLKINKRNGIRHFYVKWLDGSKTWEPEQNLPETVIEDYFVTHTQQGKVRKRQPWTATLYWLLILIMSLVTMCSSINTDSGSTLKVDGTLQRINYGTVFKDNGHIIISNEYWRHTFEVPLPTLHSIQPFINVCGKIPGNACNSVKSIITNINIIQQETRAKIAHLFAFTQLHIPIINIKKKSKRALLPFIGSLSKSFFGTATMDDVNLLASHLNALQKQSIKMANALSQHGSHLSSYMTTSNRRMDNIQFEVMKNYYAIGNITENFQSTITNIETHILDLTNLLNMQSYKASSISSEVNTVISSLQSLIEGKLTPVLVPIYSLHKAIQDIDNIYYQQITQDLL